MKYWCSSCTIRTTKRGQRAGDVPILQFLTARTARYPEKAWKLERSVFSNSSIQRSNHRDYWDPLLLIRILPIKGNFGDMPFKVQTIIPTEGSSTSDLIITAPSLLPFPFPQFPGL